MQSQYPKQIYNLPNLLILIRMGFIPILVILLYLPDQNWSLLAAGLFLIASLTDFFDGWLARKMKKVTILGQFMDPVADKLLIASMLIMISYLDRAPAWMTIIIICREIAVTGMRAVAANHNFTLTSDLWGKWKTVWQMIGVFLLVLYHPLGTFDPKFWGILVMWLAVLLTIYSGLAYTIRFQRRLEERKTNVKISLTNK